MSTRGRGSQRLNREEENLMRSSKAMLDEDRLSAIANRASNLEKIRASEPSSDAPAQRRPEPLSAPAYGQVDNEDEHDRLSVRSEESEEDVLGGRALKSVSGYLDVTHMSSETRKSAAPHIFNIYEQIFCDESTTERLPEVPEAVKESMRASGTLVDDHSLRPLSGRAELLLVIDERWSTVEQMQGGVAGFGKQLLSDLSAALGVRKDRLQLTSLSPEEQGRRAAAQLLVFPSREGNPPSALEVAAAACAQASDRGSALRSMPSTRRTAVANFREVRPVSAGGALTPRGLAGRSLGSLAPVDSRPHLSAVHQPSRSAARKGQDGFWVDVEAGAGGRVRAGAYGTFGGDAGGSRVPRWVWAVVALVAVMFAVLVVQALQRYAISLPHMPGESGAPPAEARPLNARIV